MTGPDVAGGTEAWLPAPGTHERAWLRLAFELCDGADAIAMRHFRRDLHIETKPDRTYVTQADTEIERAVRAGITAGFPGHGIVGEEFGADHEDAEFRWLIDPIDATNNFIRGIPVFATLLALQRHAESVVGIVSAPALRQRWFAWAGGGAWATERNPVGGARADDTWSPPRRLRVSAVSEIADAQLLTSSAADPELNRRLPGLRRTLERAWRERAFGDFWGYALVAEGAAESTVEVGVHPWDLGPMLLLVEEAGGRLTDFSGERTIEGRSALATNGVLHDRLMAAFRDGDPDEVGGAGERLA